MKKVVVGLIVLLFILPFTIAGNNTNQTGGGSPLFLKNVVIGGGEGVDGIVVNVNVDTGNKFYGNNTNQTGGGSPLFLKQMIKQSPSSVSLNGILIGALIAIVAVVIYNFSRRTESQRTRSRRK